MLVSAVQQCESAMYVQSCPTLYDPIDGSPPESSSMGFSRQEYWSGLPFPAPGDFSNPGIRPSSPTSPSVAGGFFTTEPSGKPKSAKCIQIWPRLGSPSPVPQSHPSRMPPSAELSSHAAQQLPVASICFTHGSACKSVLSS